MVSAMRSGYWHDLTTTDFSELDAKGVIAVLPVAATEQHGPHLPLSTDATINAGIVDRTLELLGDEPIALILPALSIGHSIEHSSFPGTLSIDTATLLDVWCQVGRSVRRAGIRKLVILNSHGGQNALVDLVAVRLRAELSLLVARANYFAFGSPEGLFAPDELAHGIHGGEAETSLMLHLAPELVRRDALANFRSWSRRLAESGTVLGAEKPVGIGWLSQDLNVDGVCGNAARADAERGSLYLEHIAHRLVTLLNEIAATNPVFIDES
jgi:creatinine amidohydrolase